MKSITSKLSESLSKLHNKEAEQLRLLTGEILIYKIGSSIIVGSELIVEVNGKYQLTSSILNENKKDIGKHYFSYLEAALTYSAAHQRGWLDICLEVKDNDERLANAESDIIVFQDKINRNVSTDKHPIYSARLSAARMRFTTAKLKIKGLSKKAKYRIKGKL